MVKKSDINSLLKLLPSACHLACIDKYTTEQRKRHKSKPLAIIQPQNVNQLCKLLNFASNRKIPIITQGGNTSLQAGAITNDKQNQILLLTSGFNKILNIDKLNSTITLEAGVKLSDAQKAANRAGFVFPQMLGAKVNSTIGGNLATNAGGVFAKKFGTTRNIVVGLEAFTASGEMICKLSEVYKDNCGFDLKQLVIGSEGTIAVITKVCIKLLPKSKLSLVYFAKVKSLKNISKLYLDLSSKYGEKILAFEVVCNKLISLANSNTNNKLNLNTKNNHDDWYFMVILEHIENTSIIENYFKVLIQKYDLENYNHSYVKDIQSLNKNPIWQFREKIIKAQTQTGYSIKHDISIKTSLISEFIIKTSKLIQDKFPFVEILPFGHFGDGNIHYNLSIPDNEIYKSHIASITSLVYQEVIAYNGSVAAEHGVGKLKKHLITKQKSELAYNYMAKIKRVFDPDNILNPDVIFKND